VVAINKTVSPLDVGQSIFQGVDSDIIDKVFKNTSLSTILRQKEKKILIAKNPKISKDTSLITVFDMLRILTKITTVPNFKIIDPAHFYNFERVYPNFTADSFTSCEICVLFAGFLFQSMSFVFCFILFI